MHPENKYSGKGNSMIRSKLAVAALVSSCSLTAISTTAFAQEASDQAAQSEARNYNIPAQPLQSALDAFAEISGSDLLYSSDLVAGKQSTAVNGSFTAPQALDRLLRGTGLAPALVSDGVYSLTARGVSTSSDAVTSPVSGIVRRAATGSALPGAVVEVAGTDLRATTDDRGFFYFPSVPGAATQVRVSYLGEPSTAVDLPTGTFARARLNISFGEQSAAGDIVVVGYLSSIQKSLNQQLRAANNSTVISADQLGGFPAETISEALRRVPGVGFGRDAETGEGSRITVRGFSSEAINIQLNGVELQGTSFGRTVDLSGFLTENLSEVTIHKSLLPSHEATGSGGLVEIETKSALDYGEFALNLNVEGEFSPEREYGEEFQLNGTLAKQFGNNFGVVATLQYRDTNRTNVDSNTLDVIPPILPAGFTSIARVPASTEFPFDPEVQQRLLFGTNFVQRDRDEKTYTGSLGFAWDIAAHTRLRLDLQRNVRDVTGTTSNASFLGSRANVDMPIAELGGEVRRRTTLAAVIPNYTLNVLDNKLTTDTISFRGDTTVGSWEFEYRAGYTFAKEDGDNSAITLGGNRLTDLSIFNADTIVFAPDNAGNLRAVGGVFVPSENGVVIPSLTPAGEAVVVDPNQFNIRIATRNLIDNTTESFNFELQTRYSPSTDFIEYIELGGLYRPTERNTIDAASNPRASNIESYVRIAGQEISIGEIDGSILGTRDLGIIGLPNFTVASIDPSVLPAAFDAIRAAGDTRFRVTDRRGLDPIQDADAFDPTRTTEDKLAAYLETQFKFGNFDLIAGVRYENEKRANRTVVSPSITTGPGLAGREPRETFLDAGLIVFEDVSGTVDSWTPSFLLNYRPADNIVARLGYFRSTVNPDLRLLNRTQRFIANLRPGLGRVSQFLPNPDLEPTVTDNIDLDIAYYFQDTVGLVRAGFFYKNVKNNFTNVLFENGDGSDVRAAYEAFFEPLRAERPDLFVFPEGTEFVLNQPVNGEGGEIYGFELELVREFDFLPGFLSDFGVVANATYTAADFPTLVSARSDEGELIQLSLDRPLRDQPEWVYNTALTYNNDGFDAIMIYTYQSATAERFDEFNINTVIPSYDTLDARISYTFERGPGTFTVYLEGDNLLQGGKEPEIRDTTSSQFGDGTASFNFPGLYQFNGGRTITAGVRARF